MFFPKRTSFALLVCIVSLNGCILAPFINSAKQSGVTSADRQRILGENIDQFYTGLLWNDAQVCVALMHSDSRTELMSLLKKKSKGRKLVQHEVESVDFNETAKQATAEITVKSYRVPYYIVEDRTDTQVWEFNFSQGWLLKSWEVGAVGAST